MDGVIRECDIPLRVVAIDPGESEIGVCVIEPFSDPPVRSLQEFNLRKYIPKDCGLSCYNSSSVTLTNAGRCVSNMIAVESGTFGHIYDVTPDENNSCGYVDDKTIVVIEKQMPIGTMNCCVLSAFQSIYEQNNVECIILDPSVLPSNFPDIFAGTRDNRTKRKAAIRKFGKMLLTQEEKLLCAQPEPEPKPGEKKKRKSRVYKASIHALDAMFYGFVCCIIHPYIRINYVQERISASSQMKLELIQHVNKAKKLEQSKPKSKKNENYKKEKIIRRESATSEGAEEIIDLTACENDKKRKKKAAYFSKRKFYKKKKHTR